MRSGNRSGVANVDALVAHSLVIGTPVGSVDRATIDAEQGEALARAIVRQRVRAVAWCVRSVYRVDSILRDAMERNDRNPLGAESTFVELRQEDLVGGMFGIAARVGFSRNGGTFRV